MNIAKTRALCDGNRSGKMGKTCDGHFRDGFLIVKTCDDHHVCLTVTGFTDAQY